MLHNLGIVIIFVILRFAIADQLQIENDTNVADKYELSRMTQRPVSICEIFGTCKAVNFIKRILRTINQLFLTDAYQVNSTDIKKKSYNEYGPLPNFHSAYYPAFDPLSLLAALAFLAFLLQSFASLFDKSRTLVSPATRAFTNFQTSYIDQPFIKYERGNEKLLPRLENVL